MNGHWDGQTVVTDASYVGIFAMIVIDDVKVKSKQVEIDGKRYQMVKDPAKGWKPSDDPSPVKIIVKFNGGDAAVILPALRDALFFKTEADALAAVPERHLADPPHAYSASTVPVAASAGAGCDCAAAESDACKRMPRPMIGETPPKLLHMVEPSFTREARAKSVSGASTVSLRINTAGSTEDLWIAKSAGYGLDENAARAVRQYTFHPATCHGTPIPVDLYIEVNFQIF